MTLAAHLWPGAPLPARVDAPRVKEALLSMLAGDIFGEYQFDRPLAIGDRLSFVDAAGYTMVKKNWFNGVKMPSIVVKELDGSLTVSREFGYDDFVGNLG